MAEYRRFVAYVYEYQRGKKGTNCGFVKIEIRESVCRVELHLRCEGMLSDAECEVYGFVRKKGLLNGILIGSCKTSENQAECVLETDSQKIGSSTYTVDELGGMIFTTDQGGFFGTEWDDQPIRPEDFQPMQMYSEKEGLSGEKITEEPVENEQIDPAEIKEQKEEESEPAGEEVPSKMIVQPQSELHTQSVADAQNQPQQKKTPQPPCRIGTPCDAFSDGELTDCRKITPQDLCRLGRRECMLRNNRFVQYGYYHFGHLLLCRNSCGQQILGVPGGYDQQERFMANMFGFPYFKESPQIQVPGGKGGYWYRLLNPADANNRNGCQ